MRKDLPKVFTEPERYGSRTKSYKLVRRRSRRNGIDEEAPSRESMKASYPGWGAQKSSDVKFSVITRLVKSWVGRPWDQFYSELRKTFSQTRRDNHIVFTHVDYLVEHQSIYVGDDGELWLRAPTAKYPDRPLREDKYQEYYVDPRTGLISKNPWFESKAKRKRDWAAQKAEEEAKVFRTIDENTVLRKVNETWFVCELRDFPKPGRGNPFQFDEFYGASVAKGWNRKVPIPGKKGKEDFYLERYHASKKSASHKLLKKMGLAT
jgi:hypothetical protein